MNKKKKVKILEILILITIIISLGTIIWLTHTYFNNEVNKSNANKIVDYSADKITLYEPNLNELNKYKIPYLDNLDKENSYYKVFIKSTDNYIKGYSEIIYLEYQDYIEETIPVEEPEEFEEIEPTTETIVKETDFKEIKKYCNGFNLIEHNYKLTCKFEDNNIYIRNDIVLPIELIKKKDYPILFELDQKLSDYLKELDEQEIKHEIVNEIK